MTSDWDWLVPFGAAIANLFICAIVLRRGWHDPLRRAFAWMTICLAAWNADLASLYFFTDAAQAEWWSRVLRVGICFAPATAFHFCLLMTNTHGPRWRALRRFAYAFASLLSAAGLAGWLVSGVTPHPWGWYPIPSPLYAAVTTNIVVFLSIIGERCVWSWRHPRSARQRVQERFFYLGCLIQVPTALSNLLPLYGINTYPLGSLGNVAFVGIVAYGIARHRLMDVDYVVRKTISFALASTAILLPGAIGLVVVSRSAPEATLLAAVTLALAAGMLVPALKAILETHVQRALFPERFGHRQGLRRLAADLVHVLDERELVRRLGDSLIDVLDVDRCEVFLVDARTGLLTQCYPASGAPAVLPEVAKLTRLIAPLLASEADAERLPAASVFHARGWEVAVPLRVTDRVTGVIAISPNRDLRLFSVEDLDLFAGVAAGASVALDNARLSRELRRSESALERAGRLSSLGMLAAGIAHEIRNPLTAVKTFLDLLPSRLDDREFLDEFRKLSLSELRRVTDLISDMLALGKSTSPERRNTPVAEVLEPITRLMDSTARKRSVQLRVACDDAVPAIWADPDQVKQIVLNLVLNAIDASPEGGIVTVAAAVTGPESVTISVRDQGVGIPPDQLANIFDPFFTTKETGTGLGLTLVHQMVVEHGGEITVDSQVDVGSTFRATFPTAADSLAATGT